MPRFSKTSLDRLEGCHSDLRKLMLEVIKHIDITILCGYRSIEEQQELNKNERFRRWLQMVQDGRTADTVKLPVGPVSCRIVMRALASNARITCLDLNGCLVGEKAGERIGDMIKTNTSILKLDVETCALGPRAAVAPQSEWTPSLRRGGCGTGLAETRWATNCRAPRHSV